MSFLATYVDCPNIQDKLNDYFTGINPSLVFENAGVMNFLNSPLNAGAGLVSQKVSPGGGKTKSLELVWRPRIPESGVSTSQVDCVPTEKTGDTLETYSIDPDNYIRSIGWQLPLSDLRTSCADRSDYLLGQIQSRMNQMDRANATYAVQQLESNEGTFVDTTGNIGVTNVKQVATKKADGDVDYQAVEEITWSSTDNNFQGVPFVFGNKLIGQYMRVLDSTCCASSGLDLGDFVAKSQYVFMQDYRVPAEFTPQNSGEPFITLDAGAVQPIFFNEYGTDQLGVSGDDSFAYGRIISPETGIPYDFFSQRVCTGGKVDVTFSLQSSMKLVFMPDDMYIDGDRLEGTNGFNQYEVVNP